MNKLRQWTTFALSPLWRWKWLFLICLIVLSSYSLFSVGDEFTWFQPIPRNQIHSTLDHGWPLTCIYRRFYFNHSWQRWTIWEDVRRVYVSSMFANLALAAVLSMTLTYLAAWRFGRHERWQFGLRDLIALTVFVALPLGVAHRLETVFQEDVAYLASLENRSLHATSHTGNPIWYRRPFRDLGLISDEAANRLSVGSEDMSAGRFDFEFDLPTSSLGMNQLIIREVNLGRRIRHPLTSAYLQDKTLDDEGIAALAQWAPSLTTLDLYPHESLSDQATATIASHWPRLTYLKFGSPQLTKESLRSLQNMNQLEKLCLCDCSRELSPGDLRLLGELPKLRTLCVPGHLLTQFTDHEREFWLDRGIVLYHTQFNFSSSIEWQH